MTAANQVADTLAGAAIIITFIICFAIWLIKR